MARDESFPDEAGVDRRTFIKAAVGIGAVGMTGALVASGATLIPPPIRPEGEVNEAFVYAKGDEPNPFGFDRFVGQEARADHFTEPWAGSATLWRALFDEEGEQIPGTGFPVLLIRVDPNLLQVPPEWVPDEDFISDPGILAVWDRCVHLCCFPQWHLEGLPSAYQDYGAEPQGETDGHLLGDGQSRLPRTFIAGEDPIWCRCHNSQYDPATLVWDVHPNGIMYIGANLAHGPATRSLAAVSIKERAGKIVGAKFTGLGLAPEPPASVQSALGGRVGREFRDWYFAYCR